ncbi:MULTISPECIES: hypothetical protein [Natrialbaceae]|uniref:hypothetical protein n=1 Tax=Natrialbaceae TaxID=1644061 RepID=UPI00207C6DB0|nr:hypothetical protein [Natronococcus sp. CG52]
MATGSEPESFGSFFRQYTKTWMHAVATAGLTAFGTLTIVHRGFVVLALASYIIPPIVLYLSRKRGGSSDDPRTPTDAALADRDEADDGPSSTSDADSLESSAAEGEPEPVTEAEPATEPKPTVETRGEPASSAEPEDEPTTEAEPEREPVTEAEPNAESTESAIDSDADDESDAEPNWQPVDAPTDATLLDAAIASSGAIAVGDGGIVLERDDERWDVLIEDGPAAQGQTLRGVDATDDGAIAWVAGDGGAVGRFDCSSGRHTDYSAPDGQTNNLSGLAVAGSSGDETVLLINGSGEVIRGRYRDGDLGWDEPVKPGSGSSLSDATLVDASVGYCCDTNDGVFETDNGGQTFETVGLEGADGTPTGIAAGEQGDCHVCTDAGVVHRFDGSTWTPERIGETALSGIARAGERLLVCDEAGDIHERAGRRAEWERADVSASAALEAVAVGEELAVAVGSEGTLIERR